MNTLVQTEQQLASWIPRKPSASLRDRIFREAPAPVRPAATRNRSITLGWWLELRRFSLATAGCFAVVTMLVWQAQHTMPMGSGSGSALPLVAASLSNQSYASYLTLDQVKLNTWSAPLAQTGEATNPAGLWLSTNRGDKPQ